MKLLYVENAKATWLFDLRLINPRGVSITSLMAPIVERYKFAKVPETPMDIKDGGLKFVEGVFRSSQGINLGLSVSVFGDGIVADTFSNTDNTTEFLRDLAQFSSELGFPFPQENKIGKSFTSILDVVFDVPIAFLNPRLESVARSIERRLVTMDGEPRVYEVAGLSIFSEDASQNKAPALFQFERKIGQSFKENQYFSKSPLETNEHLTVLEELEVALKASAPSLP